MYVSKRTVVLRRARSRFFDKFYALCRPNTRNWWQFCRIAAGIDVERQIVRSVQSVPYNDYRFAFTDITAHIYSDSLSIIDGGDPNCRPISAARVRANTVG